MEGDCVLWCHYPIHAANHLMFPPLKPQFAAADLLTVAGQQTLERCWQMRTEHPLQGVDQCPILLYQFKPDVTIARLVLVPGRIEACHKYLETIYDALQAGYEVWCLDHRGQGRSGRLCPDPQVGHVESFDDYCQDLAMVTAYIADHSTLPTLLLAHSMGGAISYRTLQYYPLLKVQAVVLCSPMFGILTPPLPNWLALALARAVSGLNRLFSARPWYAIGQGPYQHKPFEDNDLSHCEHRYRWFRDLYHHHREYQLGGVSWQWLAEALGACEAIAIGPRPSVPMLVLQAGEDSIVDNQAQQLLASEHELDLWCIPGARHELLASTDQERRACFDAINDFIRQLN